MYTELRLERHHHMGSGLSCVVISPQFSHGEQPVSSTLNLTSEHTTLAPKTVGESSAIGMTLSFDHVRGSFLRRV